jgi:four helix bundle protein
LYRLCWEKFSGWPFELKRVASQEIASVDSVHRNIAEGYCRRSIREYLNFLSIARGSLGESVSGFLTYHAAGHLSDNDFEELDALAFKLENGLLKLIESLERKRDSGDWNEDLRVKEPDTQYRVSVEKWDWRKILDETFFTLSADTEE